MAVQFWKLKRTSSVFAMRTFGLVACNGHHTLFFDVGLHLRITPPYVLATVINAKNHSVTQPSTTGNSALKKTSIEL